MITGLRGAKLSRNKKVKVRFLLGATTEDLMFHLISYLIRSSIILSYTLGKMMDLTATKAPSTWK